MSNEKQFICLHLSQLCGSCKLVARKTKCFSLFIFLLSPHISKLVFPSIFLAHASVEPLSFSIISIFHSYKKFSNLLLMCWWHIWQRKIGQGHIFGSSRRETAFWTISTEIRISKETSLYVSEKTTFSTVSFEIRI